MNVNPKFQRSNIRMFLSFLGILGILGLCIIISLVLWPSIILWITGIIWPQSCTKEGFVIQYPILIDFCTEYRCLLSSESQLEFIDGTLRNTSLTLKGNEKKHATIEVLDNCSNFLILTSESIHKYSTISNSLSHYSSILSDFKASLETYIMSVNKSRLILFTILNNMGYLYYCDTDDLKNCKKHHNFPYFESIKMYLFYENFLVLVGKENLFMHSFNDPTMSDYISGTEGKIDEIIISKSMELFLLKDSRGIKIYTKIKEKQAKMILNYKELADFKNDPKNFQYFEALFQSTNSLPYL